jgi:DNA-binding protein YbaB
VSVSAELERLTAEFEKFQARIKQAEVTFSGLGEMQERLGQLEAVATSPDRTVRVVAGAGGMVTDLQLTPEAMRKPAPALAAMIMTTMRTAIAEAARRQAGIVDETVGGAFGLNTTDQVKQAQAEALRTTVSSEATPPPKRPARPKDEDDFSQNTVYRRRR